MNLRIAISVGFLSMVGLAAVARVSASPRASEWRTRDSGHTKGHAANFVASEPNALIYICPMHADVTSSKPGTCPKCGMKLVPKPTDK